MALTETQTARVAAIINYSEKFLRELRAADSTDLTATQKARAADLLTNQQYFLQEIRNPGSTSLTSAQKARAAAARALADKPLREFRSPGSTDLSSTAKSRMASALGLGALFDNSIHGGVGAGGGQGGGGSGGGGGPPDPDPTPDPTPDLTSLDYRGAFRIAVGASPTHLRSAGQYCTITKHSDPTKLWWTTGRPIRTVHSGWIGIITIPDVNDLVPYADLSTTPIASIEWKTQQPLIDYQARQEANSPSNYLNGWVANGSELSGCVYDSSGRFYLNFAKYYHVQFDYYVESLVEYDPVTLARIGNYQLCDGESPNNLASAKPWSYPGGIVSPLAGTPLASYGDYLTTNFWNSPEGPNLSVFTINGDDTLTMEPLLEYGLANPWVSPTTGLPVSRKPNNGPAVFTTETCFIQYTDGIYPGWYGGNDGHGTPPNADANGGDLTAQSPNWLPDMWGAKGPHAPPYKQYIASVPVSQLVEVCEGTRTASNCTITLEDVTDIAYGYEIDPLGRRQPPGYWHKGFCRHGNFIYALENNADRTQAGQGSNQTSRGGVIHVFELK